MLKFRPSNLQKRTSINFNEQQLIALIEKGLSDNSLRGFLYKRSSTNSKWRLKWFLLFENLLFYFDVGQDAQQHYHQQAPSSSSSSPSKVVLNQSPSKTISSLIRRGQKSSRQQQQQQSGHNQTASLASSGRFATANETHQVEVDEDIDEDSSDKFGADDEPSSGSGGGGGNNNSRPLAATASTNPTQHVRADSKRRASSVGFNHPSETEEIAKTARYALQQTSSTRLQQASGPNSSAGLGRLATRERLSSDPQNESARILVDRGVSPQQIRPPVARKSAASRAQNSSSISGVSGHAFLGYNEQTIGRSTTTTAGKTPLKSSSNPNASTSSGPSGKSQSFFKTGSATGHNSASCSSKSNSTGVTQQSYSTLLNRKIGIIFLEGSYCERLVDSPICDEFHRAPHITSQNLAQTSSAPIISNSPIRQANQAYHRFSNQAPSEQFASFSGGGGNLSNSSTTSQNNPNNQNGLSAHRVVLLENNSFSTNMNTSTNSNSNSNSNLNSNSNSNSGTNTNSSSSLTGANANLVGLNLSSNHANQAQYQTISQQVAQQALSHVTGSCRSSAGELDIGDLIRVSDPKLTSAKLTSNKGAELDEYELLCMFTLKWKKEGSKEFQFRTETEAECQTWVHAISNARYSSLLNDKEQLEQKYLHLSQIVESESTAKWQYSRQCEELSAEIEKLRREICSMKRQENRTNHLRLVLAKSAAMVDTLLRSQMGGQSTTNGDSGDSNQAPGETSSSEQQRSHLTTTKSASSCTNSGRPVSQMASANQEPTGETTTDHQANLRAQSADCQTRFRNRANGRTGTAIDRLTGNGFAGAKSELALNSSKRPSYVAMTSAATAQLQRARSMDQEQADQDMAIRRARRCSQAIGQRQSTLANQLDRRPQSAQERRLRQLATSFDIAGSPSSATNRIATGTQSPLSRQASVSKLVERSNALLGAQSQQQYEPTTRDNLFEFYQQQIQRTQALKSLIKSADEKSLSLELRSVVEALRKDLLLSDCILEVENSEELRKIKKVQSFFRGWLCRRRWKQIVQEYIKSPHAESMRKRNNLVFKMVECEEEYVEQLTLLIAAFLRPLKMAASSQKPALDHDELNSIFLNSETLLFLHQIFLKGLTARMESWPTLVLGDLFNMLLPMLTIYQEYVRNHHFSLQVLAECKQREQFSSILRRLEEKPQLNGRTLETFLTYPMHQIPRYIICLHEILAHTPHNHVERKSLYEAQTKLEDLSRQMHDEVSETENIRQNLAIERMIIGGCDILLDINQVFVRQGILLQVVDKENSHQKGAKSRLGAAFNIYKIGSSQNNQQEADEKSSSSGLFNSYFASGGSNHDGGQTKELVRQCFLFTNHLLLCTRSKDGKLRLLEQIGKISLAGVTLIESPIEFIQQQQTEFIQEEPVPSSKTILSSRKSPANTVGWASQQDVEPTSNYLEFVGSSSANTNSSRIGTNNLPDGATQPSEKAKRASIVSAPSRWYSNSSSAVGLSGATQSSKTTTKAFGNNKASRKSQLHAISNDLGTTTTKPAAPTMNQPNQLSLGLGLRSHQSSSPQQQQQQQQKTGATFETVDRHVPEAAYSSQVSAQSGFGSSNQAPVQAPSSTKGSSSIRASGGFTSYLVAKLTNLTNLGGGGGGGSGSGGATTTTDRGAANVGTSSTPNSPATRKRLRLHSDQINNDNPPSAPTTPLKGHQTNVNVATGARHAQVGWSDSRGSQVIGSNVPASTYQSCQPASSSCQFDQTMAAIAQTSKDYAGCDFILILECHKSSASHHHSETAPLSRTTGASGSGGCLNGPGGANSSSSQIGQNGCVDHQVTTLTGTSGSNSISFQQANHHYQASGAACLPATSSWFASSGQATLIIHLVAPNLQEKAAWMSDISQCIDNVHFNDLFHGGVNDSSASITVNQSVRTDPRLHKDDVDIKFSRALNSCKLPQIRYASKERLFERLTDLRFLSIDFLNTFLLTYRVFTTAEDVLEALKSVHYNNEQYCRTGGTGSVFNCQQGAVNQDGVDLSQRDSISCYTNSSMMNLSHNQTIHDSSMHINESQAIDKRYQVPSPMISPRLDTHRQENIASRQQSRRPPPPPITIQQRIKPSPHVPPRSLNYNLNQANSSSQLDKGNNLLSTPDAQSMQKRRSTISALTPITGSNSSSLVNLTKNSLAREEELIGESQNNLQNRIDTIQRRPISSNPSNNLSECDEISNQNLFDSSIEREDHLIAKDGELRQRSSSVCVHPNTSAIDWDIKKESSNNLLVPTRQVRANSLSHVAPKILESNAIHNSNLIKQHGNEHWRLSYKKSIITAKTTSTQTVRGSSGNLLTPNFKPSGEEVVALRRKSAADVDNIRLEITLDDEASLEVKNPLDVTIKDNTVNISDQLQVIQPIVPPSTPAGIDQRYTLNNTDTKLIVARSPTDSDSNIDAQRDLQDKLYSIHDKQNLKKTSKTSKNKHDKKTKENCVRSTSPVNSITASSASSKFTSDDEYQSNKASATSTRSTSSSDIKRNTTVIPSKLIEKDTDQVIKRLGSISKNRQQSFILKEIDLAQSKLVDSDTSADESEAKSSDYSDDSDAHNGSNVVHTIKCSESKIGINLEQVVVEKISASYKDETKEIDNSTNIDLDKKLIKSIDSPHDFVATLTPISQDFYDSSTEKEASIIIDKTGNIQTDSCNEPNQAAPVKRVDARTQQISSSCMTTPRSSFQYSAADSFLNSKAGVVVTSRSPRVSSRRSSTASAASAFAAATAASSNPLLTQPPLPMRQILNKSPFGDLSCVSAASTDIGTCTCQTLHRGSVSSIQPQRRQILNQIISGDRSHHPSCIHYQVNLNSMNNNQSDASSLCNSRASSRLSSCAGLEYSQQHIYNTASGRQQQPLQPHSNSSRASYQSSMASLGCGHFGSSRYASQANIHSKRNSTAQQNCAMQQNNIRSMATLRVLSVLRHWVSKHSQDFVNDSKLASLTQDFLQDLMMDSNLLPTEHKAAIQLQQMIQKAAYSHSNQIDMDVLLAPPTKPSPDSIETLSALEIAEGMTYLDHKIFLSIKSQEFLGQAWMKSDKAIKAPHILLITKRFNDVSRLVASEIIRVPELQRRVAIIEKWTNVAHICRVIHNFNGVLQICAAFTNSSVFRLKKTWDKISKTTKSTIDQLQNLVSTDSRFRNMRDAINRCDPPSIPYVGMYLTDLSFIEEGTPNWSPEGLLNFSKMRMIAHVIREIQHLQNGVYKMDLNSRVANYLLDSSRHLQDDEMYRCSLAIEPRSSASKTGAQPGGGNQNPNQQNSNLIVTGQSGRG